MTLVNTATLQFPDLSGTLEDDIHLAARVDVPVMITADNGDHREACARRIHALAVGERRPFVTLSGDGHEGTTPPDTPSPERRATDHVTLRCKFEQALGGMLFIDEIASLTTTAQAELMSILEERARVCGRPLDQQAPPARLIVGASCHIDVQDVESELSPLLFYRLNIIHIDLMPRGNDE